MDFYNFSKRIQSGSKYELESFDLKNGKGFLPYNEPIISHNNSEFLKLSELSNRLPDLIKSGNVVSTINDNFEIDFDKIMENRDDISFILRCYSMISCISHAYEVEFGKMVNDEKAPSLIPSNLSKTFYDISEFINRVPTMTYESYVLQNYHLLEKDQGYSLENIKPIVTYSGTSFEEHFIKIHVLSEYYGGKILQYMSCAEELMQDRSEKKNYVKPLLELAGISLKDLTNTIKKMEDALPPKVFFEDLRPLLKNYEFGVKFEGLREEVFNYRGASGAQSSIIPMMDRKMGYNISQQNVMQDMLNYMPPEHQNALMNSFDIIRSSILQSQDSDLITAYNDLTESVSKFREAHYFEIIMPYIVRHVADIYSGKVIEEVNDECINHGFVSNLMMDLFVSIKLYFVENPELFPDMAGVLNETNKKLIDIFEGDKSCNQDEPDALLESMCAKVIDSVQNSYTKECSETIFYDNVGTILNKTTDLATKTFGTAGMDFAHQLQMNIISTNDHIIGEVAVESL